MGDDLDPKALLKYCRSELEAMLRCLQRAVEIESPSSSREGVDRLANFFADRFRGQSGQAEVLDHPQAGSAVTAEFWTGARGQKPILLMGHLDTVWEIGTLAQMPFHIQRGRAYGPGIFDMKGGIVCGLWAIRALQTLKIAPASPVRVFLNADEEMGSVAFREKLLEEGRRARAVLVLEPAATGGALKTARKGTGDFKVTVHGRAAHAGINPAAGINAISELARQVLAIEKLAQPKRGLTLSVGVIEGGTRANVIPELAAAWVDVRIPTIEDGARIQKKILGLKPFRRQARLEISGEINRPPLERCMAEPLFQKAREVGRKLGLDLREASTGGGSDGNFTAALGTPTLDGLGAVGEGAHARHEHVLIRELPRRAALLAALIASI